MENPKKDKKRIWDKIIYGAVVGGAIGSVIGASIAPKKGKETRKEIVEAAKNAKGRISRFFGFLKKLLKKKTATKEKTPEVKKIPNEESSSLSHHE